MSASKYKRSTFTGSKYKKADISAPKIYSNSEIKQRWEKKSNQIKILGDNIQRLRYNITTDLGNIEDQKTYLTALVLLCMDKTGERVGNMESAIQGHRGITGLLKSQVKTEGNKVVFSYTGKAGVKQEKEITNAGLSEGIRNALGFSGSKYLFCTSDGFLIKADRINRYLTDFGITAKDIRGYSANKWLIEKLNCNDIGETELDRKKEFLRLAKQVSQKVGHGLATLRNQYLIPELEPTYIKKGLIIDINDKDAYQDGGEVKRRVPNDLNTDFDFNWGDKDKKNNTIIVAHSTSSNLLPKIFREGLQPNKEKAWEDSSDNKLFFEIEPTYTYYGDNIYGWKATQAHGGGPVILYVRVNQDQLQVDKDDKVLGSKYRKNQRELKGSVPPGDILGARVFRRIDIKPEDFIELSKMFDDSIEYKTGGEIEEKDKVTFHNFHKDTNANFIKVNETDYPSGKPDFTSDSGSKYWYHAHKVYRLSNHWGNFGGGSCWLIDGKEYYNDKKPIMGVASLSDFKKKQEKRDFKIIQNSKTPKIEPIKDVVQFFKKNKEEINAFLSFVQDNPTAAAIAANQLSLNQVRFEHRMFAYNNGLDWEVIINPVIEKSIGDKRTKHEKCLSWPGKIEVVERYPEIQVSYYNKDGQKVNEEITGLKAQVFQHEIDHLNGIHCHFKKASLIESLIYKEGGVIITQYSDGDTGEIIVLDKTKLQTATFASGGIAKSVLLAPNGAISKLSAEQWHLVRTSQFKAWFGDWEKDPENSSQVIDENGEPLIVYHGSGNCFNIFKYGEFGFHFGSIEQAALIAESKNGEIRPFYLNIKNPIYSIDFPRWEAYIMSKILNKYDVISDLEMQKVHSVSNKDRKLKDILISKGFDGFIYDNEFEGQSQSYMAFKPEQIKLADNSNKTFDMNNPDIRYKEGGIVSYEDATKVNSFVNLEGLPQGTDENTMQVRSRLIREREQTPPTWQNYPIGTYAVDRFGELYQLQLLPTSQLVLKESGQNDEIVDKYANWIKKTGTILPIKGTENFVVNGGKVVVNDGHHRVKAAEIAGVNVPVWVSLTDPRKPTRPLYESDIEYHKSLDKKFMGGGETDNGNLIKDVEIKSLSDEELDKYRTYINEVWDKYEKEYKATHPFNIDLPEGKENKEKRRQIRSDYENKVRAYADEKTMFKRTLVANELNDRDRNQSNAERYKNSLFLLNEANKSAISTTHKLQIQAAIDKITNGNQYDAIEVVKYELKRLWYMGAKQFVSRLLISLNAKIYHKSEKDVSGSVYYNLPNGDRLRLSDHELPESELRLYNRSVGLGGNWIEIILDKPMPFIDLKISVLSDILDKCGNSSISRHNEEGTELLKKNIQMLLSEKYENGGDVKLNIKDYWYADKQSSVELVPVSELLKFKEFDRFSQPAHNSRTTINELKELFFKEGIKEPLIIEYSVKDKAVLLVEGNHRLATAVLKRLKYLPARVIKRNGSFPPSSKDKFMIVPGIEPNIDGYVPSALKPSQVGIKGTIPILNGQESLYKEGGSVILSYKERVSQNLNHMGTESSDWKSVPIIGFNETQDDKGRTIKMPIFDFSVMAGFTKADTLYPASGGGGKDAWTNCELCGTMIKNVYHIYDDKDKYRLQVGSECVTHFQEGKSGKEKEREAKLMLARMLDKDLEDLTGIIVSQLSKIEKQHSYQGTKNVRVWHRLETGHYLKADDKDSDFEKRVKSNLLKINFDILKGKHYQYDKSIYGKDLLGMVKPFNYDNNLKDVERGYISKETVDKQLLSWFSRNEKEQSSLINPIIDLLTAFEYKADYSSDYLNNKVVNENQGTT